MSYEYALSLNDYSRSEYWLNKALEQDPNAYVVLERLSWLYQWQNRTLESLSVCDSMIAKTPGLFNAYSTKGVTHMMRNEYPEAEACFRRSIELEPGWNNWAIFYHGLLLGLMRHWPEAKTRLDKALTGEKMDNLSQVGLIGHTLQSLFFQRRIVEGKPYFEKLIELNLYPVSTAVGFYGLGVINFNNGNLQEAETLFLKSLEFEPMPSLNTLCNKVHLALIAEKRGDYVKADSIFQAALNSAPKISSLDKSFVYASSLLVYGQFLVRQHRYADALEQFRLAEEFQPKCNQAQYGYALLAAAQKRHRRALDYLEKALEYWLPEPEPVYEEPLFKKLRKTKRFKTLISKNFPDFKL